jgi:hypothetical protein
VDVNGDPVTTLEVKVTLEGRSALPVSQFQDHGLQQVERKHTKILDFNG